MSKAISFVSENAQVLGIIYTVVAILVFLLVLAFFWWIGRAEEKERELYPEDYFYEKETAGKYMLSFVAIVFGIIAAILWVLLPLILLFFWIYEQLAKRFPSAMGNLAEYTEEREENE